MDLGKFSVSLAVKDLEASRRFYAVMGFEVIGGKAEDNWLILENGDAHIGLFQGMFDDNLLTFNPGDVRAIQAAIKDAGYAFEAEAKGDKGPAHACVKDPDGNLILIDQHSP